MRLAAIASILTSVVLSLTFALAQTVAAPQTVAAYGSKAILEKCWTAQERRGAPEDKKVVRPTSPSPADPPERLEPLHQLPPLTDDLKNSIRSVTPNGGRKIIALTFDVCERAGETTGYDAEIVNYLREHNVRATFFLGGKWMKTHPDKAMQLMADPLFEVGNHAWTHGNDRVLTGQKLREQIVWTQAEYEILRERLLQKECAKAVGAEEMNKISTVPMTYRYPYGTCGPESRRLLADLGLPAIQWTIVTGDPSPAQTPRGIAKAILHEAKPGAIVVAHANGRGHGTVGALALFVPELRAKGYEFVTASELLKSGKINSTEECFENKPGDNLRYDRMYGEGTK